MSEEKPRSEAYRCGQVYAVIEVLQALRPGGGWKLSGEGYRIDTSVTPMTNLRIAMSEVGKHYIEARLRHPVGEVDKVFGMLRDAMPLKNDFPGRLEGEAPGEFLQGREDQIALIKKETSLRLR
ncbi:hypothetical protein OG599_11670 [Streptomyces sp. NBC_01335]|uniref:hypothetical protein n=1 Tax=Streptomyces sp. NBC_01335 TaxID=2903828 RepID=UPI002E0DD8B1|nr:hypothetical protein OG599_11670 [Streptomyces sp. NBC_01335]